MKEYGGYFSLEKVSDKCVSELPPAINFNTARNALSALIKQNKYKSIYYPRLMCGNVKKTIQQRFSNLHFKEYSVNELLEPELVITGSNISPLYYVNYCAIKDSFAKNLPEHSIIDNAQAFYTKPNNKNANIYSCRKFFGVPDGALLTCPTPLSQKLISYRNIHTRHLTLRHYQNASAGYSDYLKSEALLEKSVPAGMSKFTKQIMEHIDHKEIITKRERNYNILESVLGESNQLQFLLKQRESKTIPFCYPYLPKKATKEIKSLLIENQIYLPTYWQSVIDDTKATSWEKHFASKTLFLPIDQRYSESDMHHLLSKLNKYCTFSY